MAAKTEKPTARRLRRARREGDVPVSSALMQSAALLAAVTFLPRAFEFAAHQLRAHLISALSPPTTLPSPSAVVFSCLELMLPLLSLAAIAAASVGFIQTGGGIHFARLGFQLTRADPFANLRALITKQRLIDVLRALFAAVLLAFLAVHILRSHAASLWHSVGSLPAAAALSGRLVERLLWMAALLGLVLGALDWMLQRNRWLSRLKMSRDEIKRELREAEGDPELKAARTRAHHQALDGMTLLSLKTASLVVRAPDFVVALRYAPELDPAPRVLAHGRRAQARELLLAAESCGVLIADNEDLARKLEPLEMGALIAEADYERVAEILAAANSSGPKP